MQPATAPMHPWQSQVRPRFQQAPGEWEGKVGLGQGRGQGTTALQISGTQAGVKWWNRQVLGSAKYSASLV